MCGEQVDTLKRSCVKELPPTLVLHLKRFEINFDTMMKQKINTACSFPVILDLHPFTADGISAAEESHRESQGARAFVCACLCIFWIRCL